MPGALGSYPGGIDLAGDVVYTWQDSANEYHGALRLGGKYYKFDDPQGKSETYGHGINDHQVVAGVYHNGNSIGGFLATYKYAACRDDALTAATGLTSRDAIEPMRELGSQKFSIIHMLALKVH